MSGLRRVALNRPVKLPIPRWVLNTADGIALTKEIEQRLEAQRRPLHVRFGLEPACPHSSWLVEHRVLDCSDDWETFRNPVTDETELFNVRYRFEYGKRCLHCGEIFREPHIRVLDPMRWI